MYLSRAYDDEHGDPVVVLVTRGTHDVSRLVQLLAGGHVLVEQLALGERIRRQVKRHSGGRAALQVLKAHGGADFTGADTEPPTEWIDPASGERYDLTSRWADRDGDIWEHGGWWTRLDGVALPTMDGMFVRELRDVTLPDVIACYGPLTPMDQTVELPQAGA
ncbi:MAG: phiSA1p31-related protein [Actinocrinis sp.]